MDNIVYILLTIILVVILVTIVNDKLFKRIPFTKFYQNRFISRFTQFMLPIVVASSLILIAGHTDWSPHIVLWLPAMAGIYASYQLDLERTTGTYVGSFSAEFMVVALVINLIVLILGTKVLDLVLTTIRKMFAKNEHE